MRDAPDLERATVRVWPVLAVCASIIGTAIGATYWLSGLLNDIKTQIKDQANATATVANGLEGLRKATYTLDHASEQALRMAIENPGTRVPDPRDSSKVIVVTGHGVGGSGSSVNP